MPTRRLRTYFHALERVEIDEVAAGAGKAADRERVRRADAVNLDAYPVAVEAADRKAGEAEAAAAGQR